MLYQGGKTSNMCALVIAGGQGKDGAEYKF